MDKRSFRKRSLFIFLFPSQPKTEFGKKLKNDYTSSKVSWFFFILLLTFFRTLIKYILIFYD